jgi:uncharacterized protein YutD
MLMGFCIFGIAYFLFKYIKERKNNQSQPDNTLVEEEELNEKPSNNKQ